MRVPSVNYGVRQEGRLTGPSVFNCKDNIVGTIRAAMDYEGPFVCLYEGPGASKEISDILQTIDLDGILVKRWSS